MLSLNDLADEPGLTGAVPVVDEPGGEADRRVRQVVERLWARPHHEGIGAVRSPGAQLLVRKPLLFGEPGWRLVTSLQDFEDVRGDRGGKVGVDAEQLRRRVLGHSVADKSAHVPALGHEPPVPQALHQLDQACATCAGCHPTVVGFAENPYPGIDGITRWNASDSLGGPVACEFLSHRQPDALRVVHHRFSFGPPCGGDAPA